MKKTLKRIASALFAAALVVSGAQAPAQAVSAAKQDSYEIFIAYGGDALAGGDWGYGIASSTSTDNITAAADTIAVGETKTISITLADASIYNWYYAPVLLAEGATSMDVTVTAKMDGNDVEIDAAAGDAWWYEGTGDYTDNAIRLYGGYNEWGTKYIADGGNMSFTTLEYTITLNAIGFDEAGDAEPLQEGPYDLFIAYGGDKTDGGDWGYGVADVVGNDDITVVAEKIAVGETKTVSITLAGPSVYNWYFAPVMLATGVGEMDVTVTAKMDGNDVEIDAAAGDAWWYEGTGDYSDNAIRLYGGYNEWGTQYIADGGNMSFTTLEYTVTLNSIAGASGEEAEPAGPSEAVDLNGTYNAYFGFQTPKFSFRNAFDDETYGRGTDFFNQVTGWDESNNAVVLDGTFTDVEIKGNGTYTVSVEGLNFPAGEFDTQDYMNLIFLSTDIPNSGEITISDVDLKVNGSSVDLANGPIVSPDSVDYLNILLQNIWNDDVKEIGYYMTPMTSMSITFTVSGFAYDAAVEAPAEDATPTAAPAETPTEEETKSNTGLIAGIVAAVVVVCGGAAGVVVAKKKKK